ncbi:MAG: sensor histidine kinase, partial [Ferrovibrionaceae bacterium]
VIVTGRTGNGMAEIAVTDFGVGIAPADLPRIFDRFYRAANAQGFSGTGIGLTLARTIVELHGGAIEVTSSEGAGSTFTVTLPIERSTT